MNLQRLDAMVAGTSPASGAALNVYGNVSTQCTRCWFFNNSAADGGAVHVGLKAIPVFSQCMFEGNIAFEVQQFENVSAAYLQVLLLQCSVTLQQCCCTGLICLLLLLSVNQKAEVQDSLTIICSSYCFARCFFFLFLSPPQSTTSSPLLSPHLLRSLSPSPCLLVPTLYHGAKSEHSQKVIFLRIVSTRLTGCCREASRQGLPLAVLCT